MNFDLFENLYLDFENKFERIVELLDNYMWGIK